MTTALRAIPQNPRERHATLTRTIEACDAKIAQLERELKSTRERRDSAVKLMQTLGRTES